MLDTFHQKCYHKEGVIATINSNWHRKDNNNGLVANRLSIRGWLRMHGYVMQASARKLQSRHTSTRNALPWSGPIVWSQVISFHFSSQAGKCQSRSELPCPEVS